MRLECRFEASGSERRLRAVAEAGVLRSLGALGRRVARVVLELRPEGPSQAGRLVVDFSPAGSLSLTATRGTADEALAALLEGAGPAVRRELVRRRGLADARALLRPAPALALAG